ncbi:hypothetical protein [Nocardia sp. NPDC052112]|uniref:hypothetical protein n=1 Tax=Nocardia sp. NPDC052112 TaxID=3155646 RepID=UPI00341EEEDA
MSDNMYRTALGRCYIHVAAAARYLAVATEGAPAVRSRLCLLLELAESAQSLIEALVDVSTLPQRERILFEAERAGAADPSLDEIATRWAIECGTFTSSLRELTTAAPESDRRLLEAVHRHAEYFFALCQADSAERYTCAIADFLARQELHLPVHIR